VYPVSWKPEVTEYLWTEISAFQHAKRWTVAESTTAKARSFCMRGCSPSSLDCGFSLAARFPDGSSRNINSGDEFQKMSVPVILRLGYLSDQWTVREGLFLYNHGVSPYDGGVFHQVRDLKLKLFESELQ